VKPSIGMVELGSPFEVGYDSASDILQKSEEALLKAGMQVYNTKIIIHSLETVKQAADLLSGKNFDLLLVCVYPWGEDHHVLDLLDLVDKPIMLWAYPGIETGSMCCVEQICAVLSELGRPYNHVYGSADDPEVLNDISRVASAVALHNTLKTARIGTVGGRIKGMTEIAYDEFEIKKRTGVRIINIDENELTAASEQVRAEEAEREWQCIAERGYRVSSTQPDLLESMRYYIGMKKLIQEYALAGIVVKCYPRYMGKICLGYSILAEEGFVGGCEGDVNNTVMMKILYELTSQPINNGDTLYPDAKTNTLLFSHCGSTGFSAAASKDEIHLAPVRLANHGVCCLFTAKPGKVTLANLVGRGGTMRLSVLLGDAVPTTMEFPGNPLKVRFEKPVLDIHREICDRGIGHHWMAGYGDVTRELEHFCKMTGLTYISL
jgi:L-fucose isomerase-like protein